MHDQIYFYTGVSDESDEGESEKNGSESGSDSTFGAGLGGLLHGVGSPLCVMIYSGESYNGDLGSIYVP